MNSHVRLAHPTRNGGVRMLRRGYNFTDGSDDLGRLDAGLFFIAYVRDPETQYIPMQTKLARDDGIAEYLQHTGSGAVRRPAGRPPRRLRRRHPLRLTPSRRERTNEPRRVGANAR